MLTPPSLAMRTGFTIYCLPQYYNGDIKGNLRINCETLTTRIFVFSGFINSEFSLKVFRYSRTRLTRTLKRNEKLFESAGVRVSEVGVKIRLLG